MSRHLNNIFQLTSNVNNVADVLVLSVQTINVGGGSNVYGQINWQEIY